MLPDQTQRTETNHPLTSPPTSPPNFNLQTKTPITQQNTPLSSLRISHELHVLYGPVFGSIIETHTLTPIVRYTWREVET